MYLSQHLLETRRVLRGRDDQDFPDARQHERGQRIVDHGLVVDGQQLLAHAQGDGVQPRAGAAGQNDAAPVHASPALTPMRSSR